MNNTQLKNVTDIFKHHFDSVEPQVVCAPGRVNIIGEHTDYNGGHVLPCAINYQTLISFSPREDNQIHIIAADYDSQHDSFNISDNIAFNEDTFWSNYIRGVVSVMAQRYPNLVGVNMVISGDVPQGAGLSSSAALEVGIAKVISEVSSLRLSNQTLALISQQAENEFVGCQCGIMDQLISASGHAGHVLLINCETLATAPISLPDNSAVLIVNSNVKRGLVDSEYNTRRQQCEAAAKHFGVALLCDIDIDTFEAGKQGLDNVELKRARHVVYENHRTLDAADALSKGDIKGLGDLMRASHASMKDDFEITTPEIDYLVDMLNEAIGDNGGARMTGGGFGGCVVAVLPSEHVASVCEIIESRYLQKTGIKESIYLSNACQGVHVL